MKKIILTTLTILCYNFSTCAIELQEALTSAYNNGSDFKKIQNQFLFEIEKFPEALSGFMPKVSARLLKDNTKEKNNINNNTVRSHSLSKTLNIKQPIFSGGSSVAALKAAQSSFRAARSTYYSNEQRTITKVIEAYLDCYANKEKYEIALTALNNTQKQLEAAEEKLNVGEGTTTDRANALSAVAKAEATSAITYANFKATQAIFFSMTGVEANNISLPDLPVNFTQNLDEIINKARIKNFDLENIRYTAASFKANEAIAKGALLPQVDFSLTAGNNKSAPDEAIGAQKINRNSITTQVSVNIPIYAEGGAEYARIRTAKKQTRNYVIELDKQIKLVNAQCISSWEAFKSRQSSMDASSEAVIAAQTAYDGTVQEELVGSKTILDVLDAQDKLNTAKISKIESLVEYIKSAYALKALMGELTARDLGLKVNYFNPETEFNKTKAKIIGF